MSNYLKPLTEAEFNAFTSSRPGETKVGEVSHVSEQNDGVLVSMRISDESSLEINEFLRQVLRPHFRLSLVGNWPS